MANVRIVTDSAADLPADLAASRGISVVPLTIRFGQESFLSGVDLTPDAFWERMTTSAEGPATAAPSAGTFEELYRRLADEGAQGIVSVHLSSKLSATYQSATVAAKEAPIPVEVVDTLGVSAATGLAALAAADLADTGSGAADIAAQLTDLRGRTGLYAVIDTLEYLRRGGRIGGAQALLGTMLKVKPVISLQDGVVEPVGRVRTRAKALEHLAGILRQAGDHIERLVVVNGNAPDIDAFLDLVRGVVELASDDVWTLGPVVGAHAGPGVVGVAFITKA